jgi:hypothetical protein
MVTAVEYRHVPTGARGCIADGQLDVAGAREVQKFMRLPAPV